MRKLLSGIAPLLVALSLVIPTAASAADVPANVRTVVADAGQRYFDATVAGDVKGMEAITTPNFQLMNKEGKKLGSNDLVSQWQVMSLEFGGVRGGTSLSSLTSDGTTITATFVIHAQADQVADQTSYTTTNVSAVHQLTLVNVGGAWKISADQILNRSVS